MSSVPLADPRNPLGKPDAEIGWRQISADSAAPDGGSGPGYAQAYAWETIANSAPSTSLIATASVTAHAQPQTDSSVISYIVGAASWDELRHWAETILGPES